MTTAITASEQSLIDQAFTRATGAERIEGNRVLLLRDAAENYPAWLDAIAAAERYVYFENYIIRDDAVRQAAGGSPDRARPGGREGPAPVRLGRRAREDLAAVLATSCARRGRGALLQPVPFHEPASGGCAVTTGRAWSSTDVIGIDHGAMRRRRVGGGSRAGNPAVARHGHRGRGPGGGLASSARSRALWASTGPPIPERGAPGGARPGWRAKSPCAWWPASRIAPSSFFSTS